MRVETGVIAAAGSGTRMLPVTLGYPKELLPIINRPAIQLIIDEFIASGLKKIIIIIGENTEPWFRQYKPAKPPERGKHPQLDEFLDKLAGVEIVLEQQQGDYGNGTPLIVARKFINDGETFIYAYGDDLIKSVTPFTSHLIEKHERTGALVVSTQRVPWDVVNRYGIVRLEDGNPIGRVEDVIEKPQPETASSNLAMFGRFALSTEIIRLLTEIPRGKGGELWLTDAIREYIKRGGLVVSESVEDGEWLTIGDPVNYLQTLLEFAWDDPVIRSAIAPRVRSKLDKDS